MRRFVALFLTKEASLYSDSVEPESVSIDLPGRRSLRPTQDGPWFPTFTGSGWLRPYAPGQRVGWWSASNVVQSFSPRLPPEYRSSSWRRVPDNPSKGVLSFGRGYRSRSVLRDPGLPGQFCSCKLAED